MFWALFHQGKEHVRLARKQYRPAAKTKQHSQSEEA
jgi:hypothetical protein